MVIGCVCCHLEAKTAYLIQVIQACGAKVAACASNPLSTQDDVVAALVEGGADVYAIHGETMEQYESHIKSALETEPNLIVDDGGDVITMLHEEFPELRGGHRRERGNNDRRAAAQGDGKSRRAQDTGDSVNDAQCKYMFDNRYRTGQSVWDGIMRTTNLIVAGKRVVVAGYGWCGKGVAKRAAALARA